MTGLLSAFYLFLFVCNFFNDKFVSRTGAFPQAKEQVRRIAFKVEFSSIKFNQKIIFIYFADIL